MRGENVVGIVVLVGLPALALLAHMITKRFLDAEHEDVPEREKVNASD